MLISEIFSWAPQTAPLEHTTVRLGNGPDVAHDRHHKALATRTLKSAPTSALVQAISLASHFLSAPPSRLTLGPTGSNP